MRRSAQIKGIAVGILLLVALGVWYAIFLEDREGLLTVSFLDVGQGDAIFIDAPSGRQILIDGGLGSVILRRLAEVVPWYDRSIDVVIPTHPDADHVGGLIDVLDRYKVSLIVRSSVEGNTKVARALMDKIQQENAQEVTAVRGQIIDLGKGAYLEVLSPDRSVPHVETNTGCVVVRLVYGETAFMLSCDAPQSIENYLVALDGSTRLTTGSSTSLTAGGSGLKSDVLKVGHHGSKNSSSLIFLGFVHPAYAIYSRGCNNRYGHPAPEAVARFAQLGIPTLDTCTQGTITFVSDGKTVRKTR